MEPEVGLNISGNLCIPFRELKVSFSRSGGAGGQNVNKVNTKVSLRFDVQGSPSLTTGQKRLIHERLRHRLSHNGVLLIVSSEHRTQKANRDAAVRRLSLLLKQALAPRKPRKLTGPTRASKERRLQSKQRRSKVKNQRKRVHDE